MLDGDALTLRSIKLDGARLSDEQYVAAPDRLTISQPPQRQFRLEIETWSILQQIPSCRASIAPDHLLHPVRSRRVSPHHLFPRSARRDGGLHHPHRGGKGTSAGAARQRQSHRRRRYRGRPTATMPSGTIRSRNPRICSPWSAEILPASKTVSAPCPGREVTLRIYVEPGKESRCGHAMDSLKRAMRWDETEFGREYDLDIFMIVAVSDFNMGAMENKGLNIFNDKYVLASPETATDADFDRIEAIVAHEYFHNWTGNRITCRDWFQLCLKEGLTVFRDQEFTADMRSRAVERISDVRALRAYQFDEDAGPLAHPVRPAQYHEINNFYTTTVYEKGAEVVRMLKTLLGAQKFRAGMDLYFARHDGRAATVEQFVQCFADVSGCRLAQFMLWYSQAGTPGSGRDAAATMPRARSYRLDLAQTVPADAPASRARSRWSSRLASACWAPTAATCRSSWRGGDARPRRADLEQAGPKLRLTPISWSAGPLAQSRLLGADQARRSTCQPTIAISRGAGWRRSTDGRPCRASPHDCWSTMSSALRADGPSSPAQRREGLQCAMRPHRCAWRNAASTAAASPLSSP